MSTPTLLSGSANEPLAHAVAAQLGLRCEPRRLEHFPDGELELELEGEWHGRDVYVLQPTRPPVGENLLELAMLVDACRRSNARRVTAVIPYFGYARHDRRELLGEPLGAKVVADLITRSGVDRVVVVELHSRAVEGFFDIPVEHVSSEELLAGALSQLPKLSAQSVVVSPDLGAVKRAEQLAERLSLPTAVVHKHRLSGSEVAARGVVGDVAGKAPLLVDDMISTGGTLTAAIEALLAAGCLPEVTVVACHGLFVGPAVERLRKLPIRRILVTDTVPPPAGLALPLQVVSVAPALAQAILRLAS